MSAHLLIIAFAHFAQTAHALELQNRSLTLTVVFRQPLLQAFSNLYAFLAYTIVGLCTLIFLAGAGSLVLSRGDQTKVDNGKKMIIGALIGLAISLSANAIVRTVIYFLYEGT